MKKFFIGLLCSVVCFASIHAESIKFKVEGPESSYNQVRIINNTKNSYFECKVYLLDLQEDSRFIIRNQIGTLHLKGEGDTDSCSCKVLRNSYLGVSVPDEFEVFYRISYRDYPFFDVVEIYLSDTEFYNPEEKESSRETKTGDLSAGEEF